MDVLYFTHPVFALHDTGMWHPERPVRLAAVEEGIESSGLAVHRVEPEPVKREVLELAHDPAYIDAIQRFCASGGGALDADTVASPDSWEAALRASGAGPMAVDALEAWDRDAVAFLAVRPPGHHALRNQAMGFCLFNNAGVTASLLRSRGARVAIIDWDVHHGNGTQDLLAADPGLMYLSIHQHPFYPMTGNYDETGVGEGVGTVVNVPLPAHTGGDVYRAALDRVVLPVLRQFRPDWLLVSAGFDAHEDDPLAEFRLTAADYGLMAGRLTELMAPSRVILFLEGGYHLRAITTSVGAALRGFAGREGKVEPPRSSPEAAWQALERVVRETAMHWEVS